jgi:hypothetical protein
VLYYCAYTWNQGTTQADVDARLRSVMDGKPLGAVIRGYYDLVGGGAGFLILETDDPTAVAGLLTPFMDVMRWDVRAIVARDLAQSEAAARADAES